jgi:hypothetical protein
MAKGKRKIKAHKGGRTSHIPRGRLTPEQRESLDKILDREGLSFSDWVILMVEKSEIRKL